MTKEKLLNLLGESLKAEESALPLYTKHLSSTLFLSNFDADEQQHVKRILQTLENESKGHYHTLRCLIDKIKEEKKDVY
ncbi:MAG: hypothetical protein PHQ35_05005 [Phycisphaerae bacterium]|nr:hypothetical protein [Phycisphaerae bacterium]MDD5380925.1 hypothetical protein [Phycisphaerae bacterium]